MRRTPLLVAAVAWLAVGCVRPASRASHAPIVEPASIQGSTAADHVRTHPRSRIQIVRPSIAVTIAEEGEPAAIPTRCDLRAIATSGGDVEAARLACELEALAEPSVVLGSNHEAKNLHETGRALHRAGEGLEAQRAYEQAIEADTASDEVEVSATMLAHNHLGLLARDDGDLEAARAHLQQVVDSTDEPGTRAAALHNLGLVQLDAGDVEAAQSSLEASLVLLEEALGPDHGSVGTCNHSLGVVLAERGKLGQAEPHLQRALEIRRDTLGEQHPLTAETLTSLGHLHGRQDRWGEALADQQAALVIDRAVLGEQHPTTAADQANVGEALFALDRREEAAECFERALAILADARPEDDPEVVRLHDWIALTTSARR